MLKLLRGFPLTNRFLRHYLTGPSKDKPGAYGIELADRLMNGDRFALSKAITLGILRVMNEIFHWTLRPQSSILNP